MRSILILLLLTACASPEAHECRVQAFTAYYKGDSVSPDVVGATLGGAGGIISSITASDAQRDKLHADMRKCAAIDASN